MWQTTEIWEYVESELRHSLPALYNEFATAAALVKPRLSYDDYQAWAREGVGIARRSARASETAAAYFRASVPMVQQLRFVQFAMWSRLGRELLQVSPALAAAYYHASPDVLGPIVIEEFELWTGAGKRLCKDTLRAQALAAQFLDTSPALFRLLSIDGVLALATLLEKIGARSADSAAACLDQAVPVLAKIEKRDRLPVLQLGVAFAAEDAKAARAYLSAAPVVLRRLNPKQRQSFLSLVAACARQTPAQALPLFIEGSKALAQIDQAAVAQLVAWAGEVAALAPAAGVEFLRRSPELLAKVGLTQLERWFREGLALLAPNHEAGLAYFRLQSRGSRRALNALSDVCELDAVKQVLRLYCKGLTGRDTQVLAAGELAGKGFGWTAVEQATSDGHSIFLPSLAEGFPSREENFAFFKVLATHQAAHLEFGTHDFAFARPATLFADRRAELANSSPQLTTGEFERFFDLFRERRLAKRLFVLLEDGRVDGLVLAEYPGIRQSYREARHRALAGRAAPSTMPLRQACIEMLLRFSLGEERAAQRMPRALRGVLSPLYSIAQHLWQPGSTVEDSAEATVRAYDLLLAVPNIMLESSDWSEVSAEELGELDAAADLAALQGSIAAEGTLVEEQFEDIGGVDLRGELKPELVETLMKVRREQPEGDGQGTPISPEALKRLLEKSGEIELGGLAEGKVDAAMGLFVNNLLRERGKALPTERRRERGEATAAAGSGDNGHGGIEVASFVYDEWDCHAGDYRPRWCRLSEQQLKEGELDFFQDTLRNQATLVRALCRQFEMLRPELFKKIKQLPDGEEFDLDALVEAMVAKRTGHSPSEKIYWRRNKVQRDVAVAFLLDMSASTDEEIEGTTQFNAWNEIVPHSRTKRIIDVEKESLVVLTKALQAIGDRYGIYGFSGYGRDNCEFYVIKDLDEEFGDRVKRRIDKIAPMRGTRMGVAIRHATAKLGREDTRLRILILLSDGYPQDHDYQGEERSDKEYALHDTKMALLEARRRNILPFCLTVDKGGHDYLKMMCGDIGYEIVNDVRTLPRRLPALYRLLTT